MACGEEWYDDGRSDRGDRKGSEQSLPRKKPTVYLTPEVELAGYEISCGHVGCETVHARDENKMSLFPCSPIYCRKQYLFSSC